MPRLVLLSDTHTLHDELDVPDGDILVHTGDFSMWGVETEARATARWLAKLPHAHKVIVAGNHDRCLELDPGLGDLVFKGMTYLQDSEATLLGLRFYGSPWQPEFMGWSFNLPRGEPLREIWQKIPEGIDVLLTHGPPHGVLDLTSGHENAGCEDLRAALDRVRPRLHVFGHIHEGFGTQLVGRTLCVNAAICTQEYAPTNPIIVVDVPAGGGPCTVVSSPD